MDIDLSSTDKRRLIIYAMPVVALICFAGLAMTSEAGLRDFEGPPQYDDHANAYDMEYYELGTTLTIRKEGGGDRDYIKLGFLNMNDVVTVNIDQSTNASNQVDYWVEDPNLFPIYYYQYNGLPADPIFSFNFAAIINGPYYIYHGQGLGTTYFNMTIERIPIDPPPPEKDTNNIPSARQTLVDGQTVRENAGLPWDPSDFYVINIQPSGTTNKYMTIDIATDVDTKIQWEIYDNVGINTVDIWLLGDSDLAQKRITESGDYIFRLWMVEGYGQYNLTVSILSYPNDQNNAVDEATTILDNAVQSGDVNYTFDWQDFYEIFLEADQPLWVTLTPVGGPVDLYVFDQFLNQKATSRIPDLAVDHIDGWEPNADGLFYIVVAAVYEAPNWEDPPTVDYTLNVWINFAPTSVSSGGFKNYHIDEDTIDWGYNVTLLFEDEDGDVLMYELDMSYDNTLIDIQIEDDNTLRIEPVKDASGFKIQILMNATDPHGLWTNYTTWIWVDPVNDGPFVDMEEGPFDITMGEDLVKSGVNVTKAFRDVDDDYGTWTFEVTTTPHIHVGLDDDTWLATFSPLVEHWYGVETFVVNCTDKGGERAVITFTIDMIPINDPPVIRKYIPLQEIDEEDTFSIDLENYLGGVVFEDIEGEPLTYKFDNDGDIIASISGSVITFTGAIDFTGYFSDLIIWAEDDLGASSEIMTLSFTVKDINDPPHLELILDTATVQEDEGVTFLQDVYYEYEDNDSDPLGVIWNWYVDDEKVPPEQVADKYGFEYVPPITAEKDRTVLIRLEVIDGEWTVPIQWTVSVTNLNVKPDVPVFTHDTNLTLFKEGEKIIFSASGTDLDGDDLTYKWFLDEREEVGTGMTVALSKVNKGDHKVTVEVSDGGPTTNSADFNFKVKEKEESSTPGFEGAYVALALIGVVTLIAVLRRRQ